MGRASRRPSRVLGACAILTTACLLALATRRAGPCFVAWMGQDTQQRPVAEAASRRGILSGAVLGLLPGLGWSAAQAPASAQTILDDPCRCCDKDWCVTQCTDGDSGEVTRCDCQLYLREKKGITSRNRAGDKLKIPLDHESARRKSVANGDGEEGWANELKWKDSAMMRWKNMENPRFETSNSTLGDGSFEGLFTARGLEKYTVLPPYLGRPLGVEDLLKMRGTAAMDYVFCPLQEQPLLNLTDDQLKQVAAAKPTTTFCVDGSTALERNPARYIKAARNKEECKRVNVQLCEFGNVGYFRTTKAVQGGSELIADFGPQYFEDFEGC